MAVVSYDPSGRPLDENGQVIQGEPWKYPSWDGNPADPTALPPGLPGSSGTGATTNPIDMRAGIKAAYNTSLGRDPIESDYQSWVGNNDYAAQIAASPEAQRYAQTKQAKSNPTSGSYQYPWLDPDYNYGQGAGAAPAGFDATKWADPTHNSDKYVAGRMWQLGTSVADIAKKLGYTYLGGDRMRDQQGNVIDMVRDYGPGGANAPQWGFTAAGDVGGAGGFGGTNPIFQSALSGFGGSAGPGGGPGGFGSPQANALWDMLMQRSQQTLNVNPQDPAIAGQTEAFRASQTRDLRNYLASQAEKGGFAANTNAETRMGNEKLGQNVGTFQGQLISNEIAARRQEIQSALTGMQGLLTQEQQLALTEELNKLNLLERNMEFGANLQQAAYEFDTSTGLRASGL